MKKSRNLLFWCLLCLLATATVFTGCDSGDLLDLTFSPPGRKPIDASKVGVNNFFVNNEFGSIPTQYSEIQNTLKLRYVRVLLAWLDGVQPTPNSELNYSFYDSILNNIPPGVEVIVVLTHVPSWMTDPNNWSSGGNPRQTFVNRWVGPTARRYANNPRIAGWEIWNEPDNPTLQPDEALGLIDPANYVEMLAAAADTIRRIQPRKLVIGAATESIQQDFPTHLNYNKKMKEFGAEDLVDIWNVHYYGTRFESVVTSNGVASFLNSISKPIWVTESGEQGPNEQLAFVETAWPFLSEKIPGIQRFYYYEYGSPAPVDVNYGLKTTDPAFPVSDLYVHLRDR